MISLYSQACRIYLGSTSAHGETSSVAFSPRFPAPSQPSSSSCDRHHRRCSQSRLGPHHLCHRAQDRDCRPQSMWSFCTTDGIDFFTRGSSDRHAGMHCRQRGRYFYFFLYQSDTQRHPSGDKLRFEAAGDGLASGNPAQPRLLSRTYPHLHRLELYYSHCGRGDCGERTCLSCACGQIFTCCACGAYSPRRVM